MESTNEALKIISISLDLLKKHIKENVPKEDETYIHDAILLLEESVDKLTL
jgi:hypothetical protein